MSPAEPTPAPSTAPEADVALLDDARRVLAEVERLIAADATATVPDEAVQDLLLAAVRLFSARRDQGARFPAFRGDRVTATDVAITAVAMTEVVNLELFELALWRGWSNVS
jgi:hypothetical protein